MASMQQAQAVYDARLPPSFFDEPEDDAEFCLDEARRLLKNAAALLASGDRTGARALMTEARGFLEEA